MPVWISWQLRESTSRDCLQKVSQRLSWSCLFPIRNAHLLLTDDVNTVKTRGAGGLFFFPSGFEALRQLSACLDLRMLPFWQPKESLQECLPIQPYWPYSARHWVNSGDNSFSLRMAYSNNADFIYLTSNLVNYQARPYLLEREHLTTEHI